MQNTYLTKFFHINEKFRAHYFDELLVQSVENNGDIPKSELYVFSLKSHTLDVL